MARAAALVALVGLASSATVPPVVIDVRTPWNAAPIEAEASELLAGESNALFWEFADAFNVATSATTAERKAELGEFGDAKLPGLVSDIFKAELEARAASAAVEAFLQISRDRAAAHLTADSPSECQQLFFESGNEFGCSATELASMIEAAAAGGTEGTDILSIDHTYPGVSPAEAPTVVLYGGLGSAAFTAAHTTLKAAANAGKVRYVFRHYYTGLADVKIKLPGYGVELDVKKMDYKAVNDDAVKTDDTDADDEEEKPLDGFDFKVLKSRFPEKAEELGELKGHLISMRAAIRDLKVWELQDIDIQAASRIMRSSDPAAALQEVGQNFPVLASSIISETVDDPMLDEIRENQKVLSRLGLEPGSALLTVNSKILNPVKTDLFTLFNILRTDAKLLAGLQGIGFPREVIPQVTSLGTEADGDVAAVLDTRSPQVMFANDLELDQQYKRWSTNLMELLRPAYPGQPREIARNLFTAVFILDPTSGGGMETLLSIRELITHNVPVRFGVLFHSGNPSASASGGSTKFDFTKEGVESGNAPTAESKEADAAKPANKVAIALTRAFAYIQKEETTAEAFAFVEGLAKTALQLENAMTVKKVKTALVKKYGEDAANVIKKTKWGKLLKKSEKAINEFGLVPEGGAPLLLVNGMEVPMPATDAPALRVLLTDFMDENLQNIQKALYYGQLSQTEDIYDWCLDQPHTVKRLNPLVSTLDGPMLSLTTDSPIVQNMQYAEQTPDRPKASTVWIVGDFDSTAGQHVAFDALRRQLWGEKRARIGLIHNGPILAEAASVPRLLYGLLASVSGGKALQVGGDLLAKAMNGVTDPKLLLEQLTKDQQATVLVAAGSDAVTAQLQAHAEFCRQSLAVSAGATLAVLNGRVIGPLKASDVLTVSDFKNLEKMTSTGPAGKLLKLVAKLDSSSATAADQSTMVMLAAAMIAPSKADGDDEMQQSRKLDQKYTEELVFDLSGIKLTNPEPKDTITHKILAIIDPLSKEAQHVVPVLRYLAAVTQAEVQIVLNPKEKVSEKPLNRFYRTVLPDVAGKKEPTATFKDMPTAPVLTVGMHVPPAWMVQAEKSPYDLDNIHLESAPKGVFAEFKLEFLMLEGRAYQDSNAPAAGMQLQLGTEATGPQYDTIVMANLGYFQLKAQPGAFQLKIRKGRSSDIFRFSQVHGAEGDADAANITTPTLILNKLTGKSTHVVVVRNPGKEKAKLLDAEGDGDGDGDGEDEDGGDDGMWGSFKSMLGSKGTKKVVSSDVAVDAGARSGETINVFSLASGHLYERFLKLMMLSVLKGTQNPVKFWFLKNCMSPQLQEVLPYYASEYGFEYELVQYKWPSWLNLPPTRHRQIWGYKILFLDVLFPLNLKKIIFVDADQVVRADMKELVEFDLEGAPYAYTPFCMDKTEMDGFRFWKSGYWKNHLNGRPYHISALYVVDLIRFRKLAAGDKLREQYQGLSRDPNSLANLDQDLPNNMVHQVPIKSLPQEWLWCETWCSDEIKPQAKTIDLCNNPLTKEPKLEAAVRIVKEWVDLDYEAKNMTARAEANIESGVPPAVSAEEAAGTETKDEL
jgi:UDP-glucose:glycoprotein glucosyltransferase